MKTHNQRILDFLADIEVVYRKHDLSIGHEDYQGAFLIESFSQFNLDWLKAAQDETQTTRHE